MVTTARHLCLKERKGGENRSSGFQTMSDTDQHVQCKRTVRVLKFPILVDEALYYPCSENKGGDQLYSYCTAGLRLCFCMGRNQFPHDAAQL